MDLTLPDGYTVSLDAATVTALRASHPFPGRDDLWCPPSEDRRATGVLIAQGLAERNPQGLLILTERGNRARTALERSATEAPAEPPPVRPVLDPTLPAEDAERLSAALRRLAAGDIQPAPVRQPFLVALLVFAVVPMLLLYFLQVLIPAWWGFLVAVGVPLVWSVGALHLTFRSQRKAEQETPPVVAASYEGRHVTPDALDDQGRALLARTQQAADTVLESGLHREGLLLDSVRNQVVLAETEWTIARGLGDLARSLREIEVTPITGERSRAAAERARVALAEERGHLERRIELLEEYAARVRAADDERTDGYLRTRTRGDHRPGHRSGGGPRPPRRVVSLAGSRAGGRPPPVRTHGGPVKLHLSRQPPVPLRRDMVTALFDLDRVDDPKTAAALIAQGLAERDPAGELVLTSLGEEARKELTRLVPLGVDGSGHMRATLDPALSRKRADHLTAMLNRIAAGDTDDGWWARRHPVRTTVLLVLPPMFSGRIADDIFGTWWAMFPVMFAMMGGLYLALTTWKRVVAARGPVGVAERYRRRYVAPGMLNAEDRALLERAQHAVDAILSSDLHRDGLLLDPARNKAALVAAEWAIAGTLADPVRTTHPEEQVLLLEEYATRVRTADDERTDITSARRLEEIAHRTKGSPATRPPQAEELHFLSAAQESALRLAPS